MEQQRKYMVGAEWPCYQETVNVCVVDEGDWDAFSPGLLASYHGREMPIERGLEGDPQDIGTAYAKKHGLWPCDVEANLNDRYDHWPRPTRP